MAVQPVDKKKQLKRVLRKKLEGSFIKMRECAVCVCVVQVNGWKASVIIVHGYDCVAVNSFILPV